MVSLVGVVDVVSNESKFEFLAASPTSRPMEYPCAPRVSRTSKGIPEDYNPYKSVQEQRKNFSFFEVEDASAKLLKS